LLINRGLLIGDPSFRLPPLNTYPHCHPLGGDA
jgi:hypothetical protein